VAAYTDTPVPTTALLRRDWEFLFEQLKSVHAVAEYLQRVAGKAIPLAAEPLRYYELAQADAAAPAEVLDAALLGPYFSTVSTPKLPLAPAGSEDRKKHLLIRSIFEDIAISPLGDSTEHDRLTALAELDRLPVGYRGEVGAYLLRALAEVAFDSEEADGEEEAEKVIWRLHSLRAPAGRAHLAFGASSTISKVHLWAFSQWVKLKHHDLQAITDEEDLMTVGCC
jgi:hypothetical protein